MAEPRLVVKAHEPVVGAHPDDDAGDGDPDGRDVRPALPLDRDAEEGDHEADDDDAGQARLEVVERADVQPSRHRQVGVDEQLIETGRDDEEHGADEEQVDEPDRVDDQSLVDLGLAGRGLGHAVDEDGDDPQGARGLDDHGHDEHAHDREQHEIA